MVALTSRLKLRKPAATDLIDIADINQSFDILDANPGRFICTSTSRPASPFDGQLIYETDTKMEMVRRADLGQWVPTQPIVHSMDVFAASSGTSSRLVDNLSSVVAKPYPRKFDILLTMTVSCGAITGYQIIEICGSIGQSTVGGSQARARILWVPEYDNAALTQTAMAYNVDLAADANPLARVWINVISGTATTSVDTNAGLNEFVVIERVA